MAKSNYPQTPKAGPQKREAKSESPSIRPDPIHFCLIWHDELGLNFWAVQSSMRRSHLVSVS